MPFIRRFSRPSKKVVVQVSNSMPVSRHLGESDVGGVKIIRLSAPSEEIQIIGGRRYIYGPRYRAGRGELQQLDIEDAANAPSTMFIRVPAGSIPDIKTMLDPRQKRVVVLGKPDKGYVVRHTGPGSVANKPVFIRELEPALIQAAQM